MGKGEGVWRVGWKTKKRQFPYNYIIPNCFKLKDHGYANMDGLDPSSGLLAAAMEKGLYKKTFCCYVSPDEKTPVSYKYNNNIYLQEILLHFFTTQNFCEKTFVTKSSKKILALRSGCININKDSSLSKFKTNICQYIQVI